MVISILQGIYVCPLSERIPQSHVEYADREGTAYESGDQSETSPRANRVPKNVMYYVGCTLVRLQAGEL